MTYDYVCLIALFIIVTAWFLYVDRVVHTF